MKKSLKSILAYLVLLSMTIMMVTSCGKTAQKETYPSNYEQLSALIGEKKLSVCEKLDITEEEMELINIGQYSTPLKVEYLGELFDIQLEFDVTTENNELYQFSYVKSFENEPEKAAALVKKLLAHLIQVYGKADEHQGLSKHLEKHENLADSISGEQFITINEVWDLSEKASNNIESYMNDSKQKMGYMNTEYRMNLECFYDGKSTVILSINYYVIAYGVKPVQ